MQFSAGYTLLASAVRAATQVIAQNAAAFKDIAANVAGITIYLNVTVAPGGDTVQLVLEEQDPASLVWTALAATTATAVTGMVILKILPQATAVAASTTGIVINQALPQLWRIRVVHSAGTNFTYSVGAVTFTNT